MIEDEDMDNDEMKGALAVAEVGLGKKLESYLARGRPLQAFSDDELLEARRRGLAEWAQDPASFDEAAIMPGDDANAEMSVRGMSVDYSDEERALLARAVEKLMPAYNALSLKQREVAIEAVMESYRAHRAGLN